MKKLIIAVCIITGVALIAYTSYQLGRGQFNFDSYAMGWDNGCDYGSEMYRFSKENSMITNSYFKKLQKNGFAIYAIKYFEKLEEQSKAAEKLNGSNLPN